MIKKTPDTLIDRDVVVPGERVYLGQMRKELAPLYRHWANDLEVATKVGLISRHNFPMTDEDEREWFEELRTSRSIAAFAVYEHKTGDPVGYTALIGIGSTQRGAEFGIAIGEPTARGKGYGTEATRLTLDYGFTILGLHYIWLECTSINQRALKAYERAGFKEAGRIREAGELAGERYDTVFMDILAREFESPVLRDLLGIEDMRQGQAT